ncbi:MAG: hypothetical protein ACP6IY_21895, partial [Promethearchaeia archaeon]
MRYYLLILKIVNFLIFLWIISLFTSIFDFEKVVTNPEEELVITDVISAIRNSFIYIIYAILYVLGVILALMISRMFSFVPYYDANFMYFFQGYLIKNLLSKWFSFPNGEAP